MTMYGSPPKHLTLERKVRLEKALKDVTSMDGSPDIIQSLRAALQEYKEKGIYFN